QPVETELHLGPGDWTPPRIDDMTRHEVPAPRQHEIHDAVAAAGCNAHIFMRHGDESLCRRGRPSVLERSDVFKCECAACVGIGFVHPYDLEPEIVARDFEPYVRALDGIPCIVHYGSEYAD